MSAESPPAELVRRTREGERGAAEALARRALRSSLRTAAAALGEREAASDVAQEVALEALRGLGRLREPERFDAWVHRIAVRRTSRALRARGARARAELPLSEGEATPADGDPAAEVAMRQAVYAALAELPVRQRLALVLRYVHDLPEEEVAAALGCARGTAGSLLSRGRRLIRDQRLLDDFRTVLDEREEAAR
jgi:RNA polymerase sigma-70 factor (ECF subfamily)